MQPNHKLLTSSEAAAPLRKHPGTLGRWAREGNAPIQPVRIGNRWYWSQSDIEALMRGQAERQNGGA